ncbi:MAG: 1,4-alpha-glucan branching protein GlgB [Myxococcales bacterium]|nr:1,4-alpha-glucan branching protein GlgB [Myxococcales bacterium]
MSPIGELDLHLFNEGTHTRLYERLGAHVGIVDGVEGVHFAVWAPDAERVMVVGDFNGWDHDKHPMRAVGYSGLWSCFIPGVNKGCNYKYAVYSRYHMYKAEKADPFAFYAEVPPKTASVVWEDEYAWSDEAWLAERAKRDALAAPMSIYEVHLGSWRRSPDDPEQFLGYRDLAPMLVEHVKGMGFTHVEFMPITEHPFYGSWGYQTTGYFAPTSRYGSPEDFKYLVDKLHQAGIGVILDWVPSHFPTDEHGLQYFDGTHLYEHADPRQGHHPDWKSSIFNYGRNEVRSFLLSSAFYWLDRFHIDGLRVDAVASMLYLDYSREAGEWVPNRYGGRENLEAMEFLRVLNREVYAHFPGVQTIAEESTAWPMVSRPLELGGLGFGFKWDMGWMHDTLRYFHREPAHRKWHHDELTFRGLYAFTENFVLARSHDRVVRGQGSRLDKMPGDPWQKRASLRLLYAYMFALPGKKLLFMGGEFGQWREWKHDHSLDWHLLEDAGHRGIMLCLGDLNRLYRDVPAMHELDTKPEGFRWIDCNDSQNSVLTLARLDKHGHPVVAVFNFTPVVREAYRIGVPQGGLWREALNTDAAEYAGSGVGNAGLVEAQPVPHHGLPASILLRLPPLGALFFTLE